MIHCIPRHISIPTSEYRLSWTTPARSDGRVAESHVRRVLEDIAIAKTSRVDKKNHRILGCRIVGTSSKNRARVLGLDPIRFGDALDKPYRYSIDGLRKAIPRYEGAKVFSDHADYDFDETGARVVTEYERSNDDVLGWLSGVRVVDVGDDLKDGLYADLDYFEDHPVAMRLVQAAERNPRLFAFSHEADFDADLVDGQVVITDIPEVDCVALVSSRPGTTNGLFESSGVRRP